MNEDQKGASLRRLSDRTVLDNAKRKREESNLEAIIALKKEKEMKEKLERQEREAKEREGRLDDLGINELSSDKIYHEPNDVQVKATATVKATENFEESSTNRSNNITFKNGVIGMEDNKVNGIADNIRVENNSFDNKSNNELENPMATRMKDLFFGTITLGIVTLLLCGMQDKFVIGAIVCAACCVIAIHFRVMGEIISLLQKLCNRR